MWAGTFGVSVLVRSQSRCLWFLSCAHTSILIPYSTLTWRHSLSMDMMEHQHHYANVQSQEHHHDDDSSTEVESLVGGEKGWATGDYHNGEPRSRRKIMCPPVVAALRWVLVIGLQLIVIGLLARDQGLLKSTLGKARSTSANDVGGDITGWGPHSMLHPITRDSTHTD